MPVKRWSVAGLGLCAALHLGSSLAASSIWPAQATAQSAMIADYRSLACSKEPPPPYTGNLQLQSKYDQSDASKSTLRSDPDAGTEKVGKQVKAFIGGLIYANKRFLRAKTPQEANMALACQDQWLEHWAQAGALLNPDASSTGMAARKWAVAAMASTLLLTQAASNGQVQLSPAQTRWFEQLGELIIREYQPRQAASFTWFNNHDYWAAWAVAATAMLLDDDRALAWADVALRRAFTQLTPGKGDYQYLPLEVARGRLAADYSHYALVPLMLLVEAAEHNGRPLTEQEREKLAGLANFAARAVLEPKTLAELTERQSEVGPHKMVWVLPFLTRYPQHQWAARLYQAHGKAINHYSQVGGDLKPLYPQLN